MKPPKVRPASGPTGLPPDAVFPCPPVCTAYWDAESWLRWWKRHGSQRRPEYVDTVTNELVYRDGSRRPYTPTQTVGRRPTDDTQTP